MAIVQEYEKGLFEGYLKGYKAGREDTLQEILPLRKEQKMPKYEVCRNCKYWVADNPKEIKWGVCNNPNNRRTNAYRTSTCNKFEGRPKTNLETFIETFQNAPIERTACFICNNMEIPCNFCAGCGNGGCKEGIKQWLESEVKE